MTELLDLPGESPVEILTALAGPAEPLLVEALQADRRTRVARRCADVAELLSLAEAGRGTVALVSGDFPRLDADVIVRLRRSGLRVVGVVDPDRDSRRRVRALGVDHAVAVAASDAPERIASVVAAVLGESQPAEPVRDEAVVSSAASVDPAPVAGVGYSGPAPGESAGSRSDAATDLLPAVTDEGWSPRAPGRMITVWGSPGSPGRTTVAVALAAELAAGGLEVLLVDADTYAASVASHLGVLDEAAGVVTAARAGAEGRLGPAVLDRAAPIVLPRLRLLTGITRSARWPELRPAGIEAVLRESRLVADVVVVDVAAPLDRDEDTVVDVTAPRRNGATLLAVDQADVLLAVGAADPVGLQRLVRSLQELSAAGLEHAPPPTVVVNKVRPASVGPDPARRVREALDRFAGVSSPVMLPWDPAAVDAALLAGRTLTEVAPACALRQAVQRLAARVQGRPEPAVSVGRWRQWRGAARSVTA